MADVVAKLAAPAAMSVFRRFRVSFEVPWRVKRFCRKKLLPVPRYWTLRKFLARGAVLDVYKSVDVARHREFNSALQAASLTPDWTLSPAQADELALGILTAFTSVVAPGETTQVEVRSLGARMTALYDERDARTSTAEFESSLHAVSRVRADEARSLAETWPVVERFVREFSASSERAQLLRDWVASPPNWMRDAPAPALLWMAGVAEDVGAINETVALIDKALDEGASPAAFWKLRRDLQAVEEESNLQRAALRPHLETHPIARAIMSFLDANLDDALTELETFEPGTQERRYVSFIRCQVLIAAGHLDRAFQVADAALVEGFTGPAKFVADQLLKLGSERTSAIHFAHLNRSLELALRVREEQRVWGGRSSAAALTSVRACEFLGDVERALRFTQVDPAGEATAWEAAHPQVEAHRVTLVARVLRPEQARPIVDAASVSWARAEAEAVLAEREGDRSRAEQLWLQACETATEPEDIFRIAFHLAGHGIVATKIFEVEGARSELIDEIRLLSEVSSGVPGAVERLRGSAHSSRQLVYGLLDRLQSAGDLSLAGKIAAEAGERWADAELWFAAAEFFHDAEEHHVQAVEAIRNAQRLARVDWPRLPRARQILLTALTGNGRWSEAAEVAADLVAESPNDPSGRWALVICQVHLGREGEAWSTFSELGDRLVPRNPHEMTVRIHLWRTVEKSSESLSELLDHADQWSDDRSVKLALVGALLFFTGEVPGHLTERVGERVRAITEEYPDVFIQQKFDEEDVAVSVQRMVDMLPDTSGLDSKIFEGEVPFGLAAAIHHRRLMEVLASRTTPLFANDAQRFEEEVAAARASRSSDVVIDSTAVMVLTYLDEDIATRASGYVGRVKAPLRQRIDAVASLDNLSALSTMSVGRAPSGGPAVHSISDDEAVARRDRASRSMAFYESFQIVERTWESTIPKLGDVLDDFVWMESLDLAAKLPNTVLWCDDFRVRQIATALGVPSFGTSAIIEAMRFDEVISSEIATFVQALLVSRGLVGGRFDPKLAADAAEIDGWRAGGAAAFLAFGPRADDAEEHIRFVTTAMNNNLQSPDIVQQWARSMTLWLVRIGGDENAETNLVMFLRAVLHEQWITGPVFPYVIEGIRAVTRERELPDPLEAALRAHFKTLTLVLDHPMASSIVRGLVQYGTADDRSAATRAILIQG